MLFKVTGASFSFHRYEYRSTDYILRVVPAAPEYLPVSTLQQQQAEQMQVYWKVSVSAFEFIIFLIVLSRFYLLFILFHIILISTFTIQQFIEGMLTNIGALPLDRIQTMLKFAPGYDRSIEQLALFMEAARRESLVVVRDGIWRLNK